MNTNAVVLAAGKSSRMGKNKLLLKVGGETVLKHIINSLEPIPVIVVTGHLPEDIQGLAESLGAQTVHNPNYEQGMTTSFQTGLRQVPDNVDTVFMVLSDTFGFRHELLTRMQEAIQKHPDVFLVSPMYKGRRGHPVLVHRKLFNEFLQLGIGETMKNVVNRYEDNHRYVEADVWCKVDLDTPQDYEKIKEMWLRRV